MKMATLSRVGWNLGGLAKAAGYALSGALVLGGTAFGQVLLDIEIDFADTEVDPGNNTDITITIDRADAGAEILDADVKALGAEITLPAGWKLFRDIDANCAPAISDNQISGTNSTIQVKGSNIGLIDPNTCSPIPQTGDVMEIFWIPEEGGSGDPLPVNFPVTVEATLVTPENCAGEDIDITGTVKYRVLAGVEQTATGSTDPDGIDCTGGCALIGDLDGDSSITPGDAQMAFDAFLGTITLTPEQQACGDLCVDGSVNPGDAQGMFNTFLGITPACE